MPLEILSGWKEIANHLRKGVRTAQRYERELGLPVRRPSGNTAGSVIATKAELDGWVVASPIRDVFRLPSPAVANATLLTEFRQHLKELHQLRQETARLRSELHGSVELLHTNMGRLQSQDQVVIKSSPKRRDRTPVVIFDPKRKMKVS